LSLVEGKTEFVAKVGEQIIAIKDVAAYVCENCGEAYYTPEVSRKIDVVMKKFHEFKLLFLSTRCEITLFNFYTVLKRFHALLHDFV